MTLIEEKTKEELKEKHLPVIKEKEKGIEISIGEVPHPMEEKHFIQWIEVLTKENSYKKFLLPGEKPFALFSLQDKEVKVRAYCNIHGLWTKTNKK
jgi:superoxide reductase